MKFYFIQILDIINRGILKCYQNVMNQAKYSVDWASFWNDYATWFNLL